MDGLAAADILGHGFYPERIEKREPMLDRWLRRPALWLERGIGKGSARFERLVRDVNAVQAEHDAMDLPALRAAAQALRPALKRDGFSDANVARAFALIRTVAGLTVGKRHYDVQLAGGWVLLNGRIAEMETGEGKTLTATLAAGTAALAGIPVHVVTVNDYLASRDAEEMRPVYEALGLTVGIVTHEVKPDQRGEQYAKDVTYATNKDVTFDYLRDRMKLKGRPRPLRYALNKVTGGAEAQLTLRGLHFAIVDEVDSVLVDEARTPLILSAERNDAGLERLYREALELAGKLVEGEDYAIEQHDTRMRITDAGKTRLEQLAKGKRGVWTGPNRREQLVRQALTGLHLFQRDKHYVVSDENKVQIVDEYTGRIMADRSWEAGLHQMIEVKEGCPLTGQRETIARISYQRFFRRYLRLSGMTGTAAEIKRELWDVYRLKVTRVPTRKDILRKYAPMEIHETQDAKWAAVVRSVRREVDAGRPLLVGTRSVIASETLSAKLAEAGIEHRLLNARQDKEEADIVAQGGQARRVTVATNMAGRGTDIKPTPEALAAGGLHVICTELHEAGRVDRQLWGRCARQGDPGSVETIVSYEDELIERYASFARPIAGAVTPLEKTTGPALFKIAQKRAEGVHALMRKEVLEMDDYLGDLLAFAGRPE
jgi:preprotein translocase subunit SecA